MTREEAKVKTFDILHFVADNAGLSSFEAIEKAYNMGVSEQEAVLDKLRAEIEELKPNNPNFKGYFEQNVALNKVLEILDMYKAERSDKE